MKTYPTILHDRENILSKKKIALVIVFNLKGKNFEIKCVPSKREICLRHVMSLCVRSKLFHRLNLSSP